MKFAIIFILSSLFISMGVLADTTYLLPDLITSSIHLFDQKIDTETLPGRKLLRFANATPNFGRGRLEVRGGTIHSDGSQDVHQIIYGTDGSFISRFAGTFDYHPTHNHVHFNEFANYSLRKVRMLRGLGRVVARSSKVSFCLRDSSISNPRLPGFSPLAHYKTCDNTVQGLSVGWMDVYGKDLPGQWIDITNLPRGRYWLESVVDPYNRIKESNEKNNLSRVMVFL